MLAASRLRCAAISFHKYFRAGICAFNGVFVVADCYFRRCFRDDFGWPDVVAVYAFILMTTGQDDGRCCRFPADATTAEARCPAPRCPFNVAAPNSSLQAILLMRRVFAALRYARCRCALFRRVILVTAAAYTATPISFLFSFVTSSRSNGDYAAERRYGRCRAFAPRDT